MILLTIKYLRIMLIKRNYIDERVIESYDVMGLSNADMRELTRLYDRVNEVLVNHVQGAEKKIYLNDEDLYSLVSVLDVLTENNRRSLQESVFERRMKQIKEFHTASAQAAIS